MSHIKPMNFSWKIFINCTIYLPKKCPSCKQYIFFSFFLNEKSVTNIRLYTYFREKLGSLPKIVNEVWDSMGETGEVIRKSLIWMVNTVRTVLYLLDVILLRGPTTIISISRSENFTKKWCVSWMNLSKEKLKFISQGLSKKPPKSSTMSVNPIFLCFLFFKCYWTFFLNILVRKRSPHILHSEHRERNKWAAFGVIALLE